MASHTRSKWLPCCFILLQDLLYGFGDPISKFAFDVMPVYSMLSLPGMKLYRLTQPTEVP